MCAAPAGRAGGALGLATSCRLPRHQSRIFFHPDGERDPSRARRVARAKAICADCPVIASCRSWAHQVEEPYGIWGGEGEDERRALLRRRRSAHPVPAA